MNAPLPLPLWKKLMYALGQMGWSLTSFTVGNTLNYFYVPATDTSTGETIFPIFILAPIIIGIVGFASRLFDAVTDPMIAGWSDRSKSPLGRRRFFLAVGAVPFAALSILVFYPISAASPAINSVWLFLTIIPFYFFMTMYVTPFFALLSELGHNPNERLQLSTMISVTFALGFILGQQIYLIQGLLESFVPSVRAFQLANGIFAITGCVLMFLPVIFIDEKKYSESHISKEGSFQALKSAFRNKNFLYFTLSDLTYWLSLTFIGTGMSYYVIVLLKMEKEFTSTLMTALFLSSFLFYFIIPPIARRFGKKKLMVLAFILLTTVFGLAYFMGLMPFEPQIQGFIIMALAALPLAIFGILPNAIIADIAEYDGIINNNYKAGIFFGARTFMSKLGQSITFLIFPIVITLNSGNGEKHLVDIEEGVAAASLVSEFGVRMTTVIAVIFCIVGLILFLKYDEKKILKVLSENKT